MENRKSPAGLCRESVIGDLEVSIGNTEKIPDRIIMPSGCKEETIDNKLVDSCLLQLSVDPRDQGMTYYLYLESKPIKQIKLSSRDPEAIADLITSIVNSVKVTQ